MKITHIDGSETDTDKLDDLTSELVERNHALLKWCMENKIPIYCKYIWPNRSKISGFQNFNGNVEENKTIFSQLVTDLENFTQQKIVFVDSQEIEKLDDNEEE